MQDVSKQLLETLIEKSVSEKLNNFIREFADFTKGMSEPDRKEAALTILTMVEISASHFFAKMRIRIESKSA